MKSCMERIAWMHKIIFLYYDRTTNSLVTKQKVYLSICMAGISQRAGLAKVLFLITCPIVSSGKLQRNYGSNNWTPGYCLKKKSLIIRIYVMCSDFHLSRHYSRYDIFKQILIVMGFRKCIIQYLCLSVLSRIVFNFFLIERLISRGRRYFLGAVATYNLLPSSNRYIDHFAVSTWTKITAMWLIKGSQLDVFCP